MTTPALLAIVVLLVGCIAYIFWPQAKPAAEVEKTRLDHLRERREVIYDNLRDLQFEFRAGKYPEADFLTQRNALENEAAAVLAEMDTIISAHPGSSTREQ